MGTSPEHRATTTQDTAASTPSVPVLTGVPRRELYKVSEATILLSMGRDAIYEQIKAGRLRSVRQGTARLIPAVAIREYVDLLLRESEAAYGQPA